MAQMEELVHPTEEVARQADFRSMKVGRRVRIGDLSEAAAAVCPSTVQARASNAHRRTLPVTVDGNSGRTTGSRRRFFDTRLAVRNSMKNGGFRHFGPIEARRTPDHGDARRPADRHAATRIRPIQACFRVALPLRCPNSMFVSTCELIRSLHRHVGWATAARDGHLCTKPSGADGR
jgi:hypothetical protein